MALFDLFKKKPTAPQEPAPRPVTPAPAPRPVNPAPEPRPVNPAPAPRPTAPAGDRPSNPGRNSAPSIWPKYGTTLEELIATPQLKVFIDASFVESPAFPLFRETWQKNRVNQYATRYYFILACEKQKLSLQLQQLVTNADCRELVCPSAETGFALMVQKGLNWNILWLTAKSENGIAAQNAAKKSGKIFLRWYGTDDTCKLKSLMAPGTAPPRSEGPRPVRKAPEQPTIFRPTTQPARIARTPNPVSSVPAQGGLVTAPGTGQRYSLMEPVMSDHSSITYKTNHAAYFAKIYTAKALQIDLFENKAKRMVQEKINIEGVCWPQDILTDSRGSFVGILVPASRGVQLSRSVFSGTGDIQKHFPTWDKRDVTTVAVTILRTVCALRRAGVYFGCFNPASVYIESSRKVYFVDADNWQIEGYPVLSRNITFTPPELLSDDKKVRLFTADEENYQTALLAFMLMLPGKYPYAKRNRRSEDDSIRTMAFPFSIGGDMRRSEDSERPSGAWQIVWDHLPYKMCYNFYHSFHQSGNFSKPGTRLPANTWLEQAEFFERHLASAEGAQSRSLFPATFRRDGRRNFARCSICGKEHPEFYFLRSIRVQGERVNIWDKGYRVCLPCAVDKSSDPSARFTCQCCGKTFYYTNKTQIMHRIGKLDFDWSEQKWCHDCKKRTVSCSKCGREVPVYQLKEFHDKQRNLRRNVCGTCFSDLINEDKVRREREKQRKNMVYRTVSCRNCPRSFNITYGDLEYFTAKGLNLPTRCPTCRGRR